MQYLARSTFYIFLVFALLSIGSCRDRNSKEELFRVEYIYEFDMQGGILPQLSHVYEFSHKPVNVNGVLDAEVLKKVNSANVISAELINLENDGGLKIIRRMECFIYPENTTDEYYDIAYTVELPRKQRNFIQLFSSGDELLGLYDHRFMDVQLRIWLWRIPQRSRHLRYRITVGFYR